MLINYRLGPRWRSLPPCLLSTVIGSVVSSPSHAEGAQKCNRVSLKRFKGCLYMFLLYFSILISCFLTLNLCSVIKITEWVLLIFWVTQRKSPATLVWDGRCEFLSGFWARLSLLTLHNRVNTEDIATYIYNLFIYHLAKPRIVHHNPRFTRQHTYVYMRRCEEASFGSFRPL